jgi:hypothetical protein
MIIPIRLDVQSLTFFGFPVASIMTPRRGSAEDTVQESAPFKVY